MPRRVKRLPPKKVTYRNRRRRAPNTVTQHKRRAMKVSPFPLGQHLSTKLKAAYNISVAPATYYYNHLFNLNSMFDPDRTSAGTNKQPLGFDELAAFFKEYQVYAVKIRARYIGTSDTPVMIGLCTTNEDTAIYSSTDEMSAAPGMQTRLQTKSSTNDRATVLNRYSKIHQILGVSKTAYDDVSYLAETTASPAELAYGQVVVAALDGTTNITGQLLVSLTFYSKFTKRKQLSLS